MAVTVEALNLEVTSSASSAANSVEALVEQLGRLKEVLKNSFKFKLDIGNDLAKAVSGSVAKGLRQTKAEVNKALNKEIVEPFAKHFEKGLSTVSKGQFPEKWKNLEKSRHSLSDVSKKSAKEQARQIAKLYSVDTRSYPLKDMAEDLRVARSGMGRRSGDNAAWATNDSFKAIREISGRIRESTRSKDQDVIDSIIEAGGIRLSKSDYPELRKMNMTVKSLQSSLGQMGIKVFGANGKGGSDWRSLLTPGQIKGDAIANALSYYNNGRGVTSITDLHDALTKTWNSRHENALHDPSMGLGEGVLERELVTRILDNIDVKDEKIPIADYVREAYKKAYDQYLTDQKDVAQQLVANRTVSPTKDIKDIIAENTGLAPNKELADMGQFYANQSVASEMIGMVNSSLERMAKEAKTTEDTVNAHISKLASGGKYEFGGETLPPDPINDTIHGKELLEVATDEEREYAKEVEEICKRNQEAINGVSDAVSNDVASSAKNMARATREETDNLASFYDELTKLESELEEASKKFNKFYNLYGAKDPRTVKAAISLNSARDAIDRYRHDYNKEKEASEEVKEAVEIPDTPLEALRLKAEALGEELEKTAEKGNKLQTAIKALQLMKLEKDIRGMEGAEELKTKLGEIGNAAKMTKEQFLQFKVAAEEIKLKNAWNSGNMQNIMSAVSGVQAEKNKLQSFYDEQAAGKALLADLKTAGASDGMLQFAKAELEAGKSSSVLRNKLLTVDNELKEKKKDSSEAGKALEDVGRSAKKGSNGLSKFVGGISRIARTLFIRTALRSLMRSFNEAWSAAYEYSNSMGGNFSKSIEYARGAISHVATTIVQTFAPVLTALTPIISHITASITYLCGAIQNLISLIGLSSELFGVTSAKIDQYSSSAGKGASKTNNMLAQFDELNVIQSETSGGSGGGSSKTPWKEMIQDEISSITNLLVDEALIAIGLILAFSGHVPIGIGLIALGASGIVKTLTSDWGGLSNKLKAQIAEIMAIVGVADLAIGAILTLSGVNVPLGIALMAKGAIGLATSAALSWNIDNDIRKKISVITGIVGGALLAVGSILTFTGANLPLGIALMAGGAASLAGSVALSWGLDQTIAEKTSKITAIVGGALLALGACIALTGASLPIGIGLMVAGAAGIASAVAVSWNLSPQIKQAVGLITGIVGGALLAVGAILTFTGANLPLGIGIMAAGAVGIASSVAMNWNSIVSALRGPIGLVTGLVSGALLAVGAILAFSGTNVPLGIGMLAAGGIGLVAAIAPNWESIKSKIVNVFNAITSALTLGWNVIKLAITNAWNAVSKWFDSSIITPIKNAWSAVTKFFSNLWGDWNEGTGVAGAAGNAWRAVSKWWDEGLGGKISRIWDGIKQTFINAWNTIKKPIEDVWNFIKQIFGIDEKEADYTIKVNYTETGYGNAFEGAFDNPNNKNANKVTGITSAGGSLGTFGGKKSGFQTFLEGRLKEGQDYVDKHPIDVPTKVEPIKPEVSSQCGATQSWLDKSVLSVKAKVENVQETIKSAWDVMQGVLNRNTLKATVKVESDTSSWNPFGSSGTKGGLLTGGSSSSPSVTQDFSGISSDVRTVIRNQSVVTANQNTIINDIYEAKNAIMGGIADLGNQLYGITGERSGISNMTTGFDDSGTIIPAFAGGGYPATGQMFLARESGPELIGRIGSHTAVANNDQIVRGIEGGVARAMAPIERRLARIEQYTGISAEKEPTVKITPSVALGRVNAQSAALYGQLTGR